MIATPAASAAPISPTTTSDQFGTDTASCALREAIEAARLDAAFGGCPAGSGADTISLGAGTYKLTIAGLEDLNAAGDLDIFGGGALTISHTGTSPVVIDGNDLDRVITTYDAGTSTAISGVTVRNGTAEPASNGGGIRNLGAALTLTNSTVSDNYTPASGGGITNQMSGTATLTNVTIAGNQAGFDGGGLRVASGTVTLTNVTVTGNTADDDGVGGGDGGGVIGSGPVLKLRNSIIAANVDKGGEKPDCSGGPTSLGNNVMGNTVGCGFSLTTGDIATTAPKLGTLASNGGSTDTIALLKGSPALNRASGCPSADQRGATRSLGGKCDSGAYERILCRGVLVNRVGTSAKNTLKGTSKADGLLGLGGNDTLKGLGGNDGLCGGKGNDRLFGGKGKDRLSGQAGRDTLNGGPKNDGCVGGPGRDRTRKC